MYMEPIKTSGRFDPRVSARGFCARCNQEHGMVVGYATPHARELMRRLTEKQRIDLDVPDDQGDPRLRTDYLFGDARGQMFGVLVCRDKQGREGVLKAFSGQFNGKWRVNGWVPPLVDVDILKSASGGVERYIKKLTGLIDGLPDDSPERARLTARRKEISQALMLDIHNMYRIPNFQGESRPLPEAFYGEGIPAGAADCCAPKLLGFAAKHGLKPLGLAEFYFGKANKSGTKRHGGMYTACKEKCWHILGYMLCGVHK